MDDEDTERPDEVTDDVRERMVADIYARWVNLVLLARMGNGTWRQTDRLVRFELVFPLDNDADVRVRINDEDGLWSQPRAARSFTEGHVLEPDDLVVELLEPSDVRSERYILAQFDGEHWQLEINLNVAHPRRLEHLAAALEFRDAALGALESSAFHAFYENAFHAAEHLAQAELLSYGPTVDEIANAKTHGRVRSTYQLWARLDNTDPRFATLLTELSEARSGLTYLRGNRDRDRAAAEGRAAVLNEMFEWVRGLVEDGTGPKVIRMIATADIEAGQLLGKADLALKLERSDRSDP
ncbi:hypothetical protein L2K70_10260 [Nocardioides KLBMP 9356]|uniref:HEPN domain-containing protein n=1 Tax=Nocardioides potassii TaxID=2911371 RepID=A0ABS9HD05_9ACTN|nr:hypothetical protein [Nocardioides potassii]MCF6377988.1 hypothetical protein [Nocardioides potassii]